MKNKLTSFAQFKEACRKNTFINGFTGKSRKVIEMIYVPDSFHYCGKVFETNNMQIAYKEYQALVKTLQ